ncbi:hypothetical protein IG631_21995 [Alternaria alternata]|nr:hypothetical protein IG631_21995 [Alternaria alternata]
MARDKALAYAAASEGSRHGIEGFTLRDTTVIAALLRTSTRSCSMNKVLVQRAAGT